MSDPNDRRPMTVTVAPKDAITGTLTGTPDYTRLREQTIREDKARRNLENR